MCEPESAEFVKLIELKLQKFLADKNYLGTGIICQLLYNFGNETPDLSMRQSREYIAQTSMESLRNCLRCEDHSKTRDYSISVLYMLMKENALEDDQIDASLLQDVCQCLKEDQSEWSLIFLTTLLETKPDVVALHYATFSLSHRSAIIDLCIENLFVLIGNSVLIEQFSNHFKQQSTQILTTLKNTEIALEPTEFTRLVTLFCELSAVDQSQPNLADEKKLMIQNTTKQIQEDKSLLIDTVYLLRMIHELGKSSDRNIFTPIRKISEEHPQESVENPVFGFKRDLIRLVGNMCWRHKENQDEVCTHSICMPAKVFYGYNDKKYTNLLSVVDSNPSFCQVYSSGSVV